MTKTPFPPARRVETARCAFSLHEAGPKDGVPLVMLHGWPELAHSWAPVFGPLAEAGYRCLMPDLKGFGASDRPDEARGYAMDELTADYAALLDALNLERAVFIGHDWGGAIVWPMGWRHPDRVMGIAGLCTPHAPHAPHPPLSIFERRFGEKHYIVRFQDPDAPDRAFGGHEDEFFPFVFRRTPPRKGDGAPPPEATWLLDRFAERGDGPFGHQIMSAEDIAVYADAYRRTGHRTPTHLYRMIDENWRQAEGRDLTVRCPALMVTAERDLFLPPAASEGMEERVPDLARATADSGHWITWEAPEVVTRALLDWLQDRFPTGG